MRHGKDVAVDVGERTGAFEILENLVELLLIFGGRSVEGERDHGLDSVEVLQAREDGRLLFGSREGDMDVVVVFASEAVRGFSA